MKVILLVDALINFLLGVLLLIFPPAVVNFLGIPTSSTGFYPSILGSIFIGITVALILGATQTKSRRNTGLGLMGAISINLCGGLTLAFWLVFGRLKIPTKGYVLLWALVAILFAVSLFELFRSNQSENSNLDRTTS